MENFINKIKALSPKTKIRLDNIINLKNFDKLGEKILCRLNTYMHPIPKLLNKSSALIFPNPSKPNSPLLPPRF